MASRLSRSWQSISSLLTFLPSTAPAQSPYAAIPLGPTTSSSSQPVSPHDAEKQHAFIPLAPPSPRRNQLAHAWLWVSPVLVVALAAATWVVSRPAPETGIVEPYACAPKSNWTLLRDVCAADRGADQQQVRLCPSSLPTRVVPTLLTTGPFSLVPCAERQLRARARPSPHAGAVRRHLPGTVPVRRTPLAPCPPVKPRLTLFPLQRGRACA